jgi:hypothetical protein
MFTVSDRTIDHGVGKAAMTNPAPSAQPSVSTREIVSMAALSTIVLGLVYVGVAAVR